MADFRKLFFALAVILVASVTVSAQTVPAFTCTANAAVPPTLRAEGLAELVGDLVLNCTGGTPTPAGTPVPRVNIQIFLNTNITSRWWDPAMEALLLIDEPLPAAQTPCTSTLGCSQTGVGGPVGLPYATGGLDGGTTGPGGTQTTTKNVYQSRIYAANSIVWWGVPLDPPGTTATRILRIKNVRANANQLGVSATLVPTQIVMFISVVGETSVPINNPQQIVGYVLSGISTSLRAWDGTSYGDMGWGTTGMPFLQCVSRNSGAWSSDTTALVEGHFRVRFSETFASSFKKRNVSTDPAAPLAQASPTGVGADGMLYNTETGFYNPAFVTTNNLNLAGLATSGTRLRAVFSGVPAGMKIFVTTETVSATGGNVGRLVTTDSAGAGAYSATSVVQTSLGYGWVPLTISGGVAVAVWEVTATDPLQAGRIDFGVALAYAAATAAGLPGLGTATVGLGFAPISTHTTATVSTTSPLPRFADVGVVRNVLVINPCQTNLLFPFVTNQGGFDTGIAIANTSRDPFGTATQAGSCTLNYYGEGPGGGAAPAPQTSGVVPAGTTLVFTLSAGGTLGVTATPGFQGYIIASCRFQYAHGFAFISDLGAARLSHGYLALVLDGPISTRTGFASEVLGM